MNVAITETTDNHNFLLRLPYLSKCCCRHFCFLVFLQSGKKYRKQIQDEDQDFFLMVSKSRDPKRLDQALLT